jgi:hypothetical protein
MEFSISFRELQLMITGWIDSYRWEHYWGDELTAWNVSEVVPYWQNLFSEDVEVVQTENGIKVTKLGCQAVELEFGGRIQQIGQEIYFHNSIDSLSNSVPLK